MYTEKNVKQAKSGGILVWKVQNWVDGKNWWFSRSCKKYNLQEFLEIVNEEFIKKFGFEPNFWTKNYDNRILPPSQKRVKRDDYERLISNRWSAINQRCVNGAYAHEPSVQANLQHISYKKKEIKLEMTSQEFYDWMMSVKHIHEAIVANGDKSSIDRIDDRLGYRLDNIQLVALHSNIEKRYGKKCEYDLNKEEFRRHNAKSYRKSQNKGDV